MSNEAEGKDIKREVLEKELRRLETDKQTLEKQIEVKTHRVAMVDTIIDAIRKQLETK